MLDWAFDLDVDRLAGDLTVEQRQVVEIARALSVGARFLILDEPTASLEKAAIERLFERIRRLKGSGVGILYISHHLEEIYEVCDRVTVLRDGERVLSTPVGEIKQDGKPIHTGKVDATLQQGVTYVPEDRHARGFVPYLGVGENLTLSILDRLSNWGVVSRSARNSVAAGLVEQLGIVTSSLDQPVGQLSGGNQQKVVVGRALARHPAVLVAVTPTVGVDVAAKESLLNVIGAARDGGTAVLLVSDDLEDLRICTRLLVMVKGRLVKEYLQPPWDRHELIAAVEGLEPASARGESV